MSDVIEQATRVLVNAAWPNGYRKLDPGELVEMGDQYLLDGRWCAATNYLLPGREQSKGCVYRRPLWRALKGEPLI